MALNSQFSVWFKHYLINQIEKYCKKSEPGSVRKPKAYEDHPLQELSCMSTPPCYPAILTKENNNHSSLSIGYPEGDPEGVALPKRNKMALWETNFSGRVYPQLKRKKFYTGSVTSPESEPISSKIS